MLIQQESYNIKSQCTESLAEMLHGQPLRSTGSLEDRNKLQLIALGRLPLIENSSFKK